MDLRRLLVQGILPVWRRIANLPFSHNSFLSSNISRSSNKSLYSLTMAPFTAILGKQHSAYSLCVLKRSFPEAEHILNPSAGPPEVDFYLLPTLEGGEIIGLCFLIHDHLNIHFPRLYFSVFLCFIQDVVFQ